MIKTIPPVGLGRNVRLGLLGLGWIGRHRLEAMVATGLAEACAAVEPDDRAFASAQVLVPGLERSDNLEALLLHELDGIVIATPSALHVEQTHAALAAGCAVFCQKPLGRTTLEVRSAVDAARKADRLLAIDYSYRFTEGLVEMRRQILAGELGRVFALDLVFHNAYGPDKPWFYDLAQSGGGCLVDLGVHLVDLALWLCGAGAANIAQASLRRNGALLARGGGEVEDYAVATLDLEGDVVARIGCSWRLNAGEDAHIAVSAYGRTGGMRFSNVAGSFYDFSTERLRGTERTVMFGPPEAWGGRAAADWVRRVHAGARFEPEVADAVRTARLLEDIYAAARRSD